MCGKGGIWHPISEFPYLHILKGGLLFWADVLLVCICNDDLVDARGDNAVLWFLDEWADLESENYTFGFADITMESDCNTDIDRLFLLAPAYSGLFLLLLRQSNANGLTRIYGDCYTLPVQPSVVVCWWIASNIFGYLCFRILVDVAFHICVDGAPCFVFRSLVCYLF